MEEIGKLVVACLVGMVAVALLSLIPAVLICLLWNTLIPALLGLPPIGYWQAYGLYLLCHMLFAPFVSTKD